MKKFFGKIGKKGSSSSSRPTPPPSPNLGAVGGVPVVGYEVREKDLPKLHKAVWNNDLAKVKSLVKKEVNALDKENRSALHLACAQGFKPIVQELLEWHAKPNLGDNEGKTPLLKAVECKHSDCALLLLQHNADVDTRDRNGDTAVHVAVKNSSTNILRLLIKTGADINIKNKSNFAPLHLAVKNKKDEVTKILLQSKADFDVMDGDGRTPLMYACYEGAITQVKDLISVGADTKIRDAKGFTAEDIANQKGQHACEHLLTEHNNKQSVSVASTPRLPSISVGSDLSRGSTPRQDVSDHLFGLPAANVAHDSDSDEDGTFTRSGGDDSWKSDADMSLSLHGNKRVGVGAPVRSSSLDDTDEEIELKDEVTGAPSEVGVAASKAPQQKVNLAKALGNIVNTEQQDDEDKDFEEDHEIQPKRLSSKSLQSATSAEIDWSDEDEDRSPVNTPRKASASKVSFIDKDVSEIHEITATESETDDGGEYQGSEAKRPKYDNTIQQNQVTGYLPTGLTSVNNDAVNQQKMRVEHEYANGDFMKDMGLEDDVDDFTSTPDISEMSDNLPLEDAPKPPVQVQSPNKGQDSDWDSTEPGVTPRGILKSSIKQVQNELPAPTPAKPYRESTPKSDDENDTSEWDSDVEDMLSPQKDFDICNDEEGSRRVIEIKGDGSVRGIGDSPIVIRETTSASDYTEDEMSKTPLMVSAPAKIEESEDELRTMAEIDHDINESWDSTEDEETEIEVKDKVIEVCYDGGIAGDMSPIQVRVTDDEEADSEVADAFKALEDDRSQSYKDHISKSVKEILPSPTGSNDNSRLSEGFDHDSEDDQRSQESQNRDRMEEDFDHDIDEGQNSPELSNNMDRMQEEFDHDIDEGQKSPINSYVEDRIHEEFDDEIVECQGLPDDNRLPQRFDNDIEKGQMATEMSNKEPDIDEGQIYTNDLEDFSEEKSQSIQYEIEQSESTGSNWDSTNEAATPRGPPPSQLTTSAIVVGIDNDEDEDESFDEEVREETHVEEEVVQSVVQTGLHRGLVVEESPRGDSSASPREDDSIMDELVPQGEVPELMQTGGSHASYVTTTTESQGSKETVIHVRKDVTQQQEEQEEDDDSEWDSEADQESEIDCVDNYSPAFGISPIVRGASATKDVEEDADEEEEESISEWELENKRRKLQEQVQRQKEEEEREREEELERQREAEKLAQQQEWEEIQRQEQQRRQEEEEALRRQLEEAQDQNQDSEEESESGPSQEFCIGDKVTKKSSFKEDDTSPPRRFEMKRVNYLSVSDFLKSSRSEIYKAGVTQSMISSNEETSSNLIPEPVEKDQAVVTFSQPEAPVIEEAVTSFSVTPVKSSVSQPPVVEEVIQKEEKPKTESGVTRPGRATTSQTPQKQDVEKSTDPSKTKDRKARPMSLESIDISADDDDESVDMDHMPDTERNELGSYLKTLPSSYSAYKYNGGLFDDDLISMTSTEVDDSVNYQTNSPYSKDILANMNLSDPGTVLKLQDHMHEQNKRLDHERNARLTMDNKYKSILKERNELQKKVDNLTQQRSKLEQEKLDLETRIRNLEYKMSEESEMRKNAETLLSKTKEQLNKKEEQYTSVIEAKQSSELQMRNMQSELRSANSTIKQLEEEKEEYQHQLQHEKNARQMQEQINEEQQRLHEQLQFRQAEITAKQSEAENQLEAVDEDRKHAHDSLSIQRAELTALKTELEKERKRRRDEISMMSSENEELQARIEDLKNENKMTEDALTKASMTHSLQVSNLNTEITLLSSQYDKERASKEKVDAELESLKTRLQSSSWEVDKAEQARSEVERRLQYEKEEWTKQIENSQKDNLLLKDQQQTLLHRLSNLETKLNSVENELHVANTSLLERTNQLQQCQKDLQFYKSAQDNYDQNYKLEKELNSKLQSKVENMQERMTSLQHDNLSLTQKLEWMQSSANDRSGEEAHEKFTSMLAQIKAENEKGRLNMEERNSSLSEQVTRLKDENRNLESRRSNLEQENQRLNREYTEMFKKLSLAEASHEVSSKAKEQVDKERLKLSMDLEKSQQKYETSQQKCFELQTRVAELVERAEKAENVSAQTRVQLQNSSINEGETTKKRQDLEDTLHHLQIDNTRLDAELKHERQRTEQLHKDLQDSQKVRSSLEALCSNLKSSNQILEEKREHDTSENNSMEEEVSTRALLTQEAEEHKDLWEKEVVSRSKLGLRISQYEKQRQESLSHLEEERRKASKATEKLKIAETKLENEQEKNIELQKELATMKGYLKMAKKKLKVLETGDSRVGTITTEFDKERLTMEGTLSEARQQIDSLQRALENEVEEKEKLSAKNLSLQTKIASLKHLERNVDKLERSKHKLEEEYKIYKAKIENGFVNKDELNQKEKELEAHYRLQLNRKLDEINNYLEQQARAREKLDNSRDESEYKIKDAKRKLEDENATLKIQNEQIKAQKESKEMEAKRFRDLYESEMQWRMRLSEQLVRTTDKAYGYKSKLVTERQRNRIHNNLSFSSPVNGNLDYSRLTNGDDVLSNRLRLELDRSIAKHLEAAPHDIIQPVIRTHDDSFMNSSYAKSSAEYLELLKRKYCV